VQSVLYHLQVNLNETDPSLFTSLSCIFGGAAGSMDADPVTVLSFTQQTNKFDKIYKTVSRYSTSRSTKLSVLKETPL
jgi:hypothetical protein